jgi:hypothetical protein
MWNPEIISPAFCAVNREGQRKIENAIPTFNQRMNVIKPEIGVSVLAEDQRPLTDQFAGRKTEGAQFRFVNRAGTPLVARRSEFVSMGGFSFARRSTST